MGSEGRGASLLPVGSAKFGARVGGLVSPTLVGAGVPVGARVGAAHTIALVIYSDRATAAVRAVRIDPFASVHSALSAGHERTV
jgi:hypothetical protein